MDRIAATFEECRRTGRKALVGFLTAGDPTLEESEKDLRAALENGVDILELGVPFSDPTADGPVIQEAGQRALAAGITLDKILGLAARLRDAFPAAPLILFSYANPLLAHGYERTCAEAAKAGVDGLLVVDMPFEELTELRPHLDKNGLCAISLIAPTTPLERKRRILAGAKGFVYYIMVKGVTGMRGGLVTDLETQLRELRSCTALPIAVGFGVSNGAQAREAAAHADAAVVGSALVKAAREGRLAPLVRELAAALRTQ